MNQRCCARPDRCHTPTRRAERVADEPAQGFPRSSHPIALLLLHHPACEHGLPGKAGQRQGQASVIDQRIEGSTVPQGRKSTCHGCRRSQTRSRGHSTMPLLFHMHTGHGGVWVRRRPGREHGRIRDHVASKLHPVAEDGAEFPNPRGHASIVNPDVDLTSIVTKVGNFAPAPRFTPTPRMLSPT